MHRFVPLGGTNLTGFNQAASKLGRHAGKMAGRYAGRRLVVFTAASKTQLDRHTV